MKVVGPGGIAVCAEQPPPGEAEEKWIARTAKPAAAR